MKKSQQHGRKFQQGNRFFKREVLKGKHLANQIKKPQWKTYIDPTEKKEGYQDRWKKKKKHCSSNESIKCGRNSMALAFSDTETDQAREMLSR